MNSLTFIEGMHKIYSILKEYDLTLTSSSCGVTIENGVQRFSFDFMSKNGVEGGSFYSFDIGKDYFDKLELLEKKEEAQKEKVDNIRNIRVYNKEILMDFSSVIYIKMPKNSKILTVHYVNGWINFVVEEKENEDELIERKFSCLYTPLKTTESAGTSFEYIGAISNVSLIYASIMYVYEVLNDE